MSGVLDWLVDAADPQRRRWPPCSISCVQRRVVLAAGSCRAAHRRVQVRGDDIGGIAARVRALAGPNDVHVSSTLRDLVVGSGLEFEDRGAHVLKGVPGKWRLFAVAAP